MVFFVLVPGVPDNVQLMQSSATQLSLTWARPLDPNGVISGYFVTWKKIKDDKNKTVDPASNQTTLGAETRSFLVENLG